MTSMTRAASAMLHPSRSKSSQIGRPKDSKNGARRLCGNANARLVAATPDHILDKLPEDPTSTQTPFKRGAASQTHSPCKGLWCPLPQILRSTMENMVPPCSQEASALARLWRTRYQSILKDLSWRLGRRGKAEEVGQEPRWRELSDHAKDECYFEPGIEGSAKKQP